MTSRMEARQVVIERGGSRILDAIDCELRAGELLAIIGPNGAGKSTLLSAMAGDLPLTGGEVLLDGEALEQRPASELARRRAVLPQQSSLDFPLTVQEVIALGRTPHQSSPSEDREITAHLLEMLALGALAARPYPRCSGGEQRRTQLGRVLAQLMPLDEESKFLLLDEPTANLDPARALELLDIASKLAERGVGVMAILHDPNLVSRMADRVLVLHQGKLAASGAPKDVLTEELFAEVFELHVERLEPAHLNYPVFVPMRGTTPTVFEHRLFFTPNTREERR